MLMHCPVMKKHFIIPSLEGFLRLQRTIITMIPMMRRTPAAAAPAYIAVPIPLPSSPSPVWVPSLPFKSKTCKRKEIKRMNVKTWLLRVWGTLQLVQFQRMETMRL